MKPVPVFVGNIGNDTRESELERLFLNYGKVERVDIKSGYGFVYFENKWDAEDAIRKLHRYPFGYEKRMLCVQWGRGERSSRHGDGSYQKPTKTLFVCNFDPFKTKEVDIGEHFKPYGKVIDVRIRRNFSFVRFATQEDATKALEATQRSQILGKVISVGYGLKDDDEIYDRRAGGTPKRSLSPAYNSHPIPDYGRPRSPEYDRRMSPAVYDRRRSPAAYDRRWSPSAYDRRWSPSAYDRRWSPSAYDRRRSPAAYDRRRSPSAYERRWSPAAYDRRWSPSAYDRRWSPSAYERRWSPAAYDRRRSPAAYDRRRSPSAYERNRRQGAYERSRSLDYGRRSYDYGSRRSPAYDRYRSPSPVAVPGGRIAEEYGKNPEPDATKNVCDITVSRQ